MTEKTYYENAGKGDYRRKEDKKAIERNWDAIDWSVKSSTCPKTCIKCPRDTDMRCNYCGLKQSDGSVKGLHAALASTEFQEEFAKRFNEILEKE